MFDDLLEANRSYRTQFKLGGLSRQAAKGFALVTCMDTRIDPLAILGLSPGDAKIIRNAGGRVTQDVLRSLVLAVNMLSVYRIAVMQHTQCALSGHDDVGIAAELPIEMTEAARDWEFLAMPDPDRALAADIEAIRKCELIVDGTMVEGWRYDVDTGGIDRVMAS